MEYKRCVTLASSIRVLFSLYVLDIAALMVEAKSDVWLMIKADVLDAGVEVSRCREATSLRVMLWAGVGAGVFPDISQAVKEVVKIKKSFYPEPSNVSAYKKIYHGYLCLYQRLYGKEKPSKED